MNKNRYDNSIENNNRETFKANVKSNFMENLKSVPKYAAIYYVTNIIGQYIFETEINFMSPIVGVVGFSIFTLMGLFSTNHKK